MNKAFDNIKIISFCSVLNSLILFSIIIRFAEEIYIKYISIVVFFLSSIIGIIIKKYFDYKKINIIYSYYLLPAILPILLNFYISNTLIIFYLVGTSFINVVNFNQTFKNFNRASFPPILLSLLFVLLLNLTLLPLLKWKLFVIFLIFSKLIFSLRIQTLKLDYDRKFILSSVFLVPILILLHQISYLQNISEKSLLVLYAIYSFVTCMYWIYNSKKDSILILLISIILLLNHFLARKNYLFDYSIEIIFLSTLSILIFAKTGVILSVKSKYGNIQVINDRKHKRYILYNNKIIHGYQYYVEDLKHLPTSYVGQKGPIGQFFEQVDINLIKNIGVIGLGCGTLSAYGKEGQNIDFYEIDSEVIKIAKEFFSYLSNSKANIKIFEGNARNSLSLNKNKYDLLICDAYFGGIIPSELATYEAFNLYMDNLNDNGFLIIHLSSKNPNIKTNIFRLITEFKLTAYTNSFFSIETNNLNDSTKQIGLINFNKNYDKIKTSFTKIVSFINHIFDDLIVKDNIDIENDNSDWLLAAKNSELLKFITTNSNWKLLQLDYESELINDYKVNFKK
ncbi:MAG: spermidine synthase [Alphaproteobacteria bacterium]